MRIKFLYLFMLLLPYAPGAVAQLNSNVSVEGEYEPLVIDTERINSFPGSYKFEVPAADIDYEYNGIVTDFRPSLLTMGVTGRYTDYSWKKRRGFIDFRIGSRLNSRLHAGVNILSDSLNTLKAAVKFKSSTLFRERGIPEPYTRAPRKRLYDGELRLAYTRLIGEEGLLSADASYRGAYFNYYGTTVEKSLPGANDFTIPTQTLNQLHGKVAYSSSPSILRGWHAEGGVTYTAFRRLYGPVLSGENEHGDRETKLSAGTGYVFPLAERSAIGIDGEGTFLFYPFKILNLPWIEDYDRRNYGVVSLKPQYRFSNTLLTLRAGAKLDISYDAMGARSDKNFGSFHAAPDVEIDYSGGKGVTMFLHAKGGVTPITIADTEKFDFYRMPFLLSTTPLYSPLDARIGISAGPFAGFAAEASFRYTIAKNVPVGGWYQVFLGTYLPHELDADLSAISDPYTQRINLNGCSVNLNLSYSYGTTIKLDFDATYTPQKGTTGIFNGFDRPKWLLSAKGTARPVKRLCIELGYNYRGVRNCYLAEESFKGISLTAYRLSDITDLHAKVAFSVLDNLDIYCKAENLLNSHPELLPGLQGEGITVMGGFFLTF